MAGSMRRSTTPATATSRCRSLAVEEVDQVLAVNARGVFLAMKHEIAAMLASGGGAIVNMTSTAGLRGVKGIAAYVAGKHAIVGLTRTAALDYANRGIRVNAVAPGPIDSHRLEHLPEQIRAGIAAAVPLGRIGNTHEVAAAVTWLASDRASFITGATLPIDGGKTAAGA
jgi:NAD(P)-dependent dehydrogenase (short-subunit alcohol dehydrogenase family)